MTALTSINLNATNTTLGIITICIILIAYVLVILEETIELRKSKPVLIAAALTWIIVAVIGKQQGLSDLVTIHLQKNLLEYAELLLFLIVAMSYINAMTERKVFEKLRGCLINAKFSLKQLFWITGLLAFIISPIADNLTTALLMSTIITTIARKNHQFISYACINIVVAVNAGGAFSPFGDLTTLMVWQSNKLQFLDFFNLFIPAVVSFVIPSWLISRKITNEQPELITENIKLKFGAQSIVALFLITIVFTVISNNTLNLPPVMGMMLGLGLLKVFGFIIKKYSNDSADRSYNIFKCIEQVEWDTLLFFYGIIMCLGGLGALGYLSALSKMIYGELGGQLPAIYQPTPANIIVGILSSIIDNIPLMFAVLAMDPIMVKWQWLLITLTLGIGGSLLSIGSAAGVALMGCSNGFYTFSKHLKWTWAIFLGYIGAIFTHFLVNKIH